jgi:signal transduction histidine kinase
MSSQHSNLSPARTSHPPKRSVRALARLPGFRVKLKPRRDALTRVRHDLRSLLQSVLGYTDLLAEPRYGSLTSEQRRFVSNVRAAAAHLYELVDACIELSRPANDNGLELPVVQLGQTVQRVHNTLKDRQMCCDVAIAPELAARCLSLDVQLLERAMVSLCSVLTREGAVALQLRASQLEQELVLTLHASDAPDLCSPLAALDSLEDQLGNRDFVRLKLAEVLLTRLGFTMRMSATVDVAELVIKL